MTEPDQQTPVQAAGLLPSNLQADTSDKWNNLLTDIFGSIRAEPRDREPFRASIAALCIGDVSLIQCRSRPANVFHRPQDMPSGGKNDFIVKVQMQGNSVIRRRDSELALKPGDYLICDNSQPYCLAFEEETTIISIPVAETYLRRFSPFPNDVSFVPVDGANPIHRVSYDYLHSLWRNDVNQMSDFAKARLAETFLELAVLSIADQKRLLAPARPSHREIYHRCCNFIDQNFMDEDLTPEQIAAANGISLRLLQATFAEQGTSVRQFLTARRLQEAMHILEAPIYRSRSISEISYKAGFKNLATFSRAFKEHFGRSPSEVRSS